MDTAPQRNNTTIWIVIYLGIILGFTFLGFVVGVVYYSITPASFRSDATIRLVASPLVLGKEAAYEHTQLLSQTEFINSTLESKDLYGLGCFDSLPQGSIVANVINNLEVNPNKTEPEIVELSFNSPHPDDAQTILTNLIADFGDAIEEIKVSPSKTELMDSIQKSNSEMAPEIMAELAIAQRLRKSGQVQAYNMQILRSATFGEPTWPILPLILAFTGSIGLLLGMTIVVSIFLFSQRMAKQPASI